VIGHLVLGSLLVTAGIGMILTRRRIASWIEPKLSKSRVYSNPLYYLAVGYAVLAFGLIFAVSALAGFYN
jgi:hypothetical protein